MSEPKEYTFGDEAEPDTRARQEKDVRSMTRSTFGTEQANLKDEKRLDPTTFIAEARRKFFEFAKESGLNAHEALHSWGDGVEVEGTAVVAVCAGDYCKYKIAEKLGITVEELDRQRDEQAHQMSERISALLRPKPRNPETLN